jgi:hypothetical protein
MLQEGKNKITCPFCEGTVRVEKPQATAPAAPDFSTVAKDQEATPMPWGEQIQQFAQQIQQLDVPHEPPMVAGDVPPGNKIRVEMFGPKEIHIVVRGCNWGIGCMMLFFALFWNMIVCTIAFGGTGPGLFILPFGIIGMVVLLIALFLVFGSTRVILQREKCTVQKKFWLFGYTSTLLTADITEVRYVEAYRQNNRPVYGVGLCTGLRKTSFGSTLNDEAKAWLLHFVRRSLEELRKL